MYSWGRIVNSLTKILGSIGWGGSQPSKYWKIYWYGLAQQVWGKYMASFRQALAGAGGVVRDSYRTFAVIACRELAVIACRIAIAFLIDGAINW